jgi:hypothetical protein
MCISRLVEFELLLELKIEQKKGTSLVKLVLLLRKSASRQSVCPSQLYWENIATDLLGTRHLKKAGINPELHRLDNETSKELTALQLLCR